MDDDSRPLGCSLKSLHKRLDLKKDRKPKVKKGSSPGSQGHSTFFLREN